MHFRYALSENKVSHTYRLRVIVIVIVIVIALISLISFFHLSLLFSFYESVPAHLEIFISFSGFPGNKGATLYKVTFLRL